MLIDILSLFPNYFTGPFDESIIGQARKKGLLTINLIDIRSFADNRYRKVDDRPYGGGPGMVMMCQPILSALRSVRKKNSRVIYMSPQGQPLTAAKCRELAQHEHMILLCGHYEGIDERILDEIDEEISIGDYVLTSGCGGAAILVEATARFVPGVLGHPDSASKDSFERGLLGYPQYTRPEIYEGKVVPPVLLSGDHEKIAQWRRNKALEKTKRVRPKLIFNCED